MKWEVRTMRSGTSFFDWTVFKKTVCRFWPLWGAYFAVWLVMLPLNGLMFLQMDQHNTGYMEDFAFHMVPEAAPELALQLTLVFGVLAAMAVFSHLYNPRSANFFGGLPVRREGLFLTHYLAGLAFLIVPNVIVFLLTLLVEAIGGAVFLPGLWFWLAATCGECLFFYSMSVFCGMFTGHILALPAFYGIGNILVFGVCVLLSTVFQRFYYGFNGFGPWMQGLVEWFTPVLNLGPGVRGWYNGGTFQSRGLGMVAAYAGAAAVLAACSFFLYRARRLESAGDVVSVKAMRPVFQYGVAFCAGLAFGMVTTMFTGAWSDIHHIIRRQHRVLIVLYHKQGIAHILQVPQRVQQFIIVSLMQADAGLIQNIAYTYQAGANLGCQPDSLCFPAGQRASCP